MDKYMVECIKSALRKGDFDSAQNIIFQHIESAMLFIKDRIEQDDQCVQDFNNILQVIYQSIECQDVILLCDMVEYELAPFIHSMIETRDVRESNNL